MTTRAESDPPGGEPSARRLPPLRALQAFAAVVRHDGMRRAAERLHLSHAALSQHVQHLEEAFGLRLLDRSGGRARPTPLGREFGEALIDGFERIEAATARLRLRGDESRRLLLGAPTSLSVSVLLPRIEEFSARAGFDLQLICPAGAADLAQARVHALLMHRDPHEQGLRGELLFEQALRPVASPGCARAWTRSAGGSIRCPARACCMWSATVGAKTGRPGSAPTPRPGRCRS